MDLNTANITASILSTNQPSLNSGKSKTADDIKSSDPIPTSPHKNNKLSKEINNFPETSMGFLFNENLSGHAITVIKNKKTGETLRIIPTEEQLKIKKQMAESTGQLLDQIT